MVMFKVAVSGSEDNDKIKTNCVRALGNLLQLVDDELLSDSRFQESTARATAALTANATSGSNMKVRWNACYALNSVLKNSELYANKRIDLRKIFSVLTELVVAFKNFKVRINAALALSAPQTRSLYGEFYVSTWLALVKALETSQNIDDFTEYKHRDNLVDQVIWRPFPFQIRPDKNCSFQICLGIAHLILLLTPEDLAHLKDGIVHRFDVLKSYMRRVIERVLPEKASVLSEAATFLRSKKSHDAWQQQRHALKLLAEVFEDG